LQGANQKKKKITGGKNKTHTQITGSINLFTLKSIMIFYVNENDVCCNMKKNENNAYSIVIISMKKNHVRIKSS
jgi:hypothetical protein